MTILSKVMGHLLLDMFRIKLIMDLVYKKREAI